MPDFSASVTGGVVLEQWEDPAFGVTPSRINPEPERPPTRWVATVGVAVTLTARVNGVDAPLDGALGGRLFTGEVAEAPTPTVIIGTGGQSSVQTFIPTAAGHYTLIMRRPQGGGVWLHVDARV